MKQAFLTSTFVAVALGLVAFVAPKETYKINTNATTIGWVGKKVTGQHNGTVKVSGGTLEVTNGKITGGEFLIDMNSIVCEDLKDPATNAKLVNHLKSDDFFSVDKYPTATFKIKNANPGAVKDGKQLYRIAGNLTIKGITKHVEFDAETKSEGNKIMATAAFRIDRSKWDIRFRSGSFFENLGDTMIYDDIELTLNAVFEK
ncbi:MAG: YceI family protein [Cytophagales bacterium]|nr:YceI family protein [Cytophagales bacterium]